MNDWTQAFMAMACVGLGFTMGWCIRSAIGLISDRQHIDMIRTFEALIAAERVRYKDWIDALYAEKGDRRDGSIPPEGT